MKKNKKVLLAILIPLLFCCGIAYIVLYCIYPNQTQTITLDIIDYVCNKPLPIVGVTTLVLAITLYNLIKFAISHKSGKVSDLIEEIAELKKELESVKDNSNIIAQSVVDNYNKGCEQLKEICDSIPNKKVKLLGVKFYGKEIDSETKEN